VGVARKFPQRAALDIVNTVFGGRFTSILNTKLRIESGLTYGASSSFVRATVPGEFSIRSFTQTDTTGKALDLALATLAQLRTQGVTPAALASGRDYVIGQYPLRFETANHWASALGELEFYGLDRSWIEDYGPSLARVTPEDARAVIAAAFPAADDVAIVLIGDAAKIRGSAQKLGPVTEMPFTAPRFLP
jgi:predicted Zn-dependent peptidase